MQLEKDLRPTNIIERNYPIEIEDKLPSVYVWDEEKYILGGENVISWMEEILEHPNILLSLAKETDEENDENSHNNENTKYFSLPLPLPRENAINYETSTLSDDLNGIITFASINLWADKHNRDSRFTNFCEIMKSMEPDILCIQEINETILQKLIQQNWAKAYFKSTYHISKNTNVTGEVIFSKFPILRKETFPFNNTVSGQTIHIAHIQIPMNYFQLPNSNGGCHENESMSFPVITAQLEKTNKELRKEQIHSMFNMVLPLPNVFMMVDTNITDEDSDFINLPEEWKDAYEDNFSNLEMTNDQEEMRLYAETNTFTFDSDYNTYVNAYQRYRYDRMLYKSKSGWKCGDFELICNEVPVSTHFGLFTTFVLSN
jgi:exonuclease III